MLLSRLKIIDKDRGWKRIMRLIQQTKSRPHTTVGVHEEEGAKPYAGSKLNTREVGILHEYGEGGQLERSFVRSTVDAKGKEIAAKARELSNQMLSGQLTTRRALDLLGQFIKKEMKGRITAGEITPPNAPSTIAKKGGSKPMLDTTQMRDSITHKVEMGPK